MLECYKFENNSVSSNCVPAVKAHAIRSVSSL